MAVISIAATGLITRSKTISAAHTTRLLAAFRKVYGQIITQPYVPAVPPVLDSQGNVITPGVPEIPEVRRDMTDQEIFNRFADGVFESFVSTVQSAETTTAVDAAVIAAKASVTPIVFT